jgi:hypothetical protein
MAVTIAVFTGLAMLSTPRVSTAANTANIIETLARR